MDRISRGLCFSCGERYHPLHQCATKSLRLLILGDGEDCGEVAEDKEMAAMEVEQGTEGEGMEIRIIGLLGLSMEKIQNCKTLRFEATINGAPILVLVDSRAIHNFVAPQVALRLDLKVDYSKKNAVKLRDGHHVFAMGRCSRVPLQIGELILVVEAYVLDLGGMDIILGVAWLRSLGKITMDYWEMTMSFLFQDRPVLLRGISNGARKYNLCDFQALSMNELKDDSFREVEGWLWNIEISTLTEYEGKLS